MRNKIVAIIIIIAVILDERRTGCQKKWLMKNLDVFVVFIVFCCFGICFAICFDVGLIFSQICIGFGAENTGFYYTGCWIFDFMVF